MRALSRGFAAATVVLLTGAILPTAAAGQDEQPPEDWKIRTDRPNQDVSEIFFVDMPPGWHVTTGPAGIFWDPANTASGSYRVEMEVYLFDPGSRREAFGFFMGGSDLEGSGQAYTYFLIRNGGQFLVKQRAGADTPTLVPWTDNEAILAWEDREEGGATVLNTLAAEVDDAQVRFFVNGEEVHRMPRTGLALDGIVGLRVNHGLNLHISRLEVTAGG